jgi:PPM family protein phosphatase
VTIRWNAAGGTDVGRVREGNEDSFRLVSERGIFLVADGMGGHAAGEVASAVAADAVLEVLASTPATGDADPSREMPRAFAEARRRMVERRHADPALSGMGTTLTVSVLQPDGTIHIGHIGDSRLYHLHRGSLSLLTHDHTWTQQEVDAGRIPAEAARNHPFAHVLTRVLAVEEPAEPDVQAAVVSAGDTLLLCSDGLHNMIDGRGILEILAMGGQPADLVRLLIDTANRRGGSDNITAIVVQIGQGDPDGQWS